MEDLLQKHALVENDIAQQAERVQSASAAALKFANGDSKCANMSFPLANVLIVYMCRLIKWHLSLQMSAVILKTTKLAKL